MGTSQYKFRAIVIDDVDFCRDLLAEFLEGRGYQVLTFPDVTSCPLFSASDPHCPQQAACTDFLLLDNLMPHMTGLDFLELQQQSNCLLQVAGKAIFSANWTPAGLARAAQLGCKSFHKPYDFEKLGAWLDDQEKRCSPDRVLAEIENVMGGKKTS